jgi:hypothetical protein
MGLFKHSNRVACNRTQGRFAFYEKQRTKVSTYFHLLIITRPYASCNQLAPHSASCQNLDNPGIGTFLKLFQLLKNSKSLAFPTSAKPPEDPRSTKRFPSTHATV